VQSTDCFDCGPEAEGNHCTARGFKANVKTYSVPGGGNPCPQIPDTLPDTIDELNAVFSCQDMAEDNNEDVWCASVTTCGSGKLVSIYSDGEALSLDDETSMIASLSNPDQWLASGPPPLDEAGAFFTAAQTLSAEEMPALLVECMNAYAAVPAISNLHANVKLEFYQPEESLINIYSISGLVAADGRFALQIPSRSAAEGEAPRIVVEELAFDGATLFDGYQGEPYYRAYSSASSRQPLVLELHGRYLDPLQDWVSDPLRVLRFPGTAYSSEELPNGIVEITESYAQTGIQSPLGLGTTTYTIDTSSTTPHVLRIDVRNDHGDLRHRRMFSDFQSISNGIWRPFLVTEQRYRGSEEEPQLTKTVRILRANRLESSEIESEWWRPASDQNWWYIYN
jgi:hypothetical protein